MVWKTKLPVFRQAGCVARHFGICFGLALLLLAGTGRVSGQAVKGTLVGSVFDPSGGAVLGAEVEVTEIATNITRSTKTGADGYYALPLLDPGVYRVKVRMAGFKTATQSGVVIPPNSTVRADFTLEVGAVTESIEVSAAVLELQTDRVDLGRKIETNLLRNLPLAFNRNYQSLIALVPGVTRPFRTHSEFYNSQDSLSANVNGQIRHGTSSLLEGLDNNWDDGNLTLLIPPIEAIATVDIVTSNYDPEFGRATGAVVNAVLRSGGNSFEGSLFAFNRVSALGARNVFAATKPPVTYNLFGGTLGGPIRRNRTFFFGDYQGVRDRLGSLTLVTIPTPDFRAGNFTAAPTAIYDPSTGTPDGRNRTPFPGNVVPVGRISPIARRILDAVPAPNLPGYAANYRQNLSRAKDNNSFDIKIDHMLRASHSFFVRYSHQRPIVEDPPLYGLFGGPRNGGFAGTGKARIQSPGINYVASFNPTLLAEFRFGITRVRNDALNSDFGKTTARDVGIPGANIDDWSSGMSAIQITGYSNPVVGYSPSLPWRRAWTNFDFVNNWTKIASSHMLKAGFNLRRIRTDLLQTQQFNPRGRFDFTPGTTALNGGPPSGYANAFASFLLDQPNQYGRDLYVHFPTVRQWVLVYYLQDKWQLRPSLTLDLGLRHELWPAARPRFARGFASWDPETNLVLVGGYGNIPPNLGYKGAWKSLAPRTGFAWRLGERTVIRAGYGISYLFRPQTGSSSGFVGYPYQQVNVFNAPNAFVAAGSMASGFPPPVFVQVPDNGMFEPPLTVAVSARQIAIPHHYVQAWNLAVQRKLPWAFVLETAYVGNHGVNFLASKDINAGLILGAGAAGQPLNIKYGRRSAVSAYAGSDTHYHSLQVKFDRHFQAGLGITTAYTFQKSTDICSDRYCSPHVQYNFRLNRGRSDFDRTHVFIQSYIYELPFGRNRRWVTSGPWRWVVGDWQLNAIFTAQTGTPIHVTIDAASLNTPGNGNRPDVSGKPRVFGLVGTGAKWFDTSVFSPPAPARFGTAGRNILVGPGLVNVDFSIFRHFALTEKSRMELRAEAFNLSNTPHFNNPGGMFGTPTFGQVTTAQNDARAIQLGAKITF